MTGHDAEPGKLTPKIYKNIFNDPLHWQCMFGFGLLFSICLGGPIFKVRGMVAMFPVGALAGHWCNNEINKGQAELMNIDLNTLDK